MKSALIPNFEAEVKPFVQFLGWPRSGTTLLMSLLNAYPGIFISHEADVSAQIASGCDRDQILACMSAANDAFARRGHHWFGYDYRIAGLSMPKTAAEESFSDSEYGILGDKKAGGTAEIFALHPEIFRRTEEVLERPLRLLVVVRNPFDVIATISRNLPGDAPPWFRIGSDSVAGAIDWYALLTTFVQRAVDAKPCPIHLLSFTKLIDNPADTLADILRFLGILGVSENLDPSYAAMARAAVFPNERRPSSRVDWTREQVCRVRSVVESTPILSAQLGDFG